MAPISALTRAGLFGVIGLAAIVAVNVVKDRPHPANVPVPEAALHSGFGHLQLSPALTSGNLTIYPVYSDAPAPAHPAPAEFLTLAEGMDKGTVTARESDQGCVRGSAASRPLPAGVMLADPSVTNAEQGQEHRNANIVMVTNVAPQPTYVPDGQVVPGGGQDRGTAADTVVPARSAEVGVAAFCVEQHRSTGPSAAFSKDIVLAIPSVRYSMQVTGEQRPVWDSVATATRRMRATTPTGTYGALIRSADAQAAVQPYTAALTVPVQSATPGRVVGVVAAINGRIVCADLYRNPTLFSQMWPSLLRSYALQAAMCRGGNLQAAPSAPATGKWLAALDSAAGTPTRSAQTTAVARVSTSGGAGTRTAAITRLSPASGHGMGLLHEAFWTSAAAMTD